MNAEVCAERLHCICEESTIADNEPYKKFLPNINWTKALYRATILY